MEPEFRPADWEARERIRKELDSSLFVEAGAGTGKTTAMVGRIINLIRTGSTDIERLAAITFTEKAAAELRDKVRDELEKAAEGGSLQEEEKVRCRRAVRGMEMASIQTLHSFAGALLREKPLEAGLPPNFSISDEIEADIRFEKRWQQWLEELQGMDRRGTALAASEKADRLEELKRRDVTSAASAADGSEDPSLQEELLRLLTLGLKLGSLRDIAAEMHSSYDLIGASIPQPHHPPRRAVREMVEALPLLQRLAGRCKDPSDYMLEHLAKVMALAGRLAQMDQDGDYALNTLRRWGSLKKNKTGRKTNWTNDPEYGNALEAVREKLDELDSLLQAELEAIKQAALAAVLEQLCLKVLAYAAERRAEGRAEFHDLLVWARDLLRDNWELRLHFQNKYSHILIDEFQDTDPIQAEIAFYLASGPAADSGDADEKDWKKLKPLPGKIFVVGDPKQSIYRFRRADIATVDEVRRLMAAGNAPLTHNFRSQQPVIEWVNGVFSQWMQEKESVQARYLPLAHAELDPAVRLQQCVWRLGGHAGDGEDGIEGSGMEGNLLVDDVRRAEYQGVAKLLHHMRTAPWQVRSMDNMLRPAEFRDICILLPTRTGLDLLERALEESNIPYRIESQSYILGTQDVVDLLNCLRAIDSPADQVALVGALRSAAFACSDIDLLEYVECGGKLDYTEPGMGKIRVHEALEVLKRYHEDRAWKKVDRLIEDFIIERGLKQASYGRARPREKLRRLQMVVELARSYARVEGNSLRGYLDWLDRLAEERARMQEAPVPDTDEDAVRIMTIHAAKGLEFPIVMLLGLNNEGGGRSPAVLFDKQEGRIEARAGAGKAAFQTAGYADLKLAEDEAETAEGVRLMYVAATRARDHLVLSLWHNNVKCRAAKILELYGEDEPGWTAADLSNVKLYAPGGAPPVQERSDSEEDYNDWREKRSHTMQYAGIRAASGVTGIVQIVKEQAGGEDAFYRTGRGGTNLGRAVHSVLQRIDLASRAGLEDLCRAQADAEGIPGGRDEVAKLVRNGLDTEVVKRAVASGDYHREVFVSAMVEGSLLEGFMDIVFEEDGGLVIADYKTDAIQDEEALLQKKDKYQLQAGLYALLAEKATGKEVKEVVLVFLRSKQEERVRDLAHLKQLAAQAVSTYTAAGI